MKSSEPVTHCGCDDAKGDQPKAYSLSAAEKVSLLEEIVTRNFPLHMFSLLTAAVIKPGPTQQIFKHFITKH